MPCTWLLKQKGLKVTRDEVRRLVLSNVSKQLLGAAMPTKGNIATEDQGTRWQADLAEFFKDTDNKSSKYALVVVNVFDRKLYTRPLPNKQPMTVRTAMKSIVDGAPETPKIISHDQGSEFIAKPMKDYLSIMDIQQRNKEKGDPNALGVVDRAIGLLKKKLAIIVGTEGGDWGTQLERATKSLNNTPKPGVLHGEAPNSVEDSDAAQFMLLTDNARKIKHNEDLKTQRTKALNRDGNAFRAPVKIDKKWKKRGFRATYGPIQRASDINHGWVTGLDNKNYDLKLIKPVRT